MRRICVFCGSSRGRHPAHAEAARQLGAALARRGLGLVYGGGRVGLMGEVADAVLNAGGEAIGVIPEALVAREIGHDGLTELRVVGSMHERKALMGELADAFVALPGGYGTLEEISEALTWTQLGLHLKPCGFLDVDGYFDFLLAFMDRAVEEGFLAAAHRSIALHERDPEVLLQRLESWRPPAVDKWIERGET
jgi:uncharacterized protein (TIGR00730 family)